MTPLSTKSNGRYGERARIAIINYILNEWLLLNAIYQLGLKYNTYIKIIPSYIIE